MEAIRVILKEVCDMENTISFETNLIHVYLNFRYFVKICQKMLKNLLCWSFFLLPFGSGLYFHIGETERKCFIEEIPDETMVRFFYYFKLTDLSYTYP